MEYSDFLLSIIVMLLALGGAGFTMIGMPGNVLIFLIALGYGYLDGFVHMNYHALIVLFAAVVVGELAESVAGAAGAKKEKASLRAIVAAFFGGVAGAVVGTGILPVIGSVVGALVGGFVGSYLAEYSKNYDAAKAGRVAHSVVKGQMIGLCIKFAIAIAMIVYVWLQLPWPQLF